MGILRVGTSGFAYPDWAPRFYPPGLRGGELLRFYAEQLGACELNSTYYQRPSAARLRAWRDATPEGFRFAVKAQRGGTFRALHGDPSGPVGWLTEALPELGPRLGTVLLRVPLEVERDDARLDDLLAAWPPSVPLALELQHPSWHVGETFARLRATGAVLCATELDADAVPPDLRVTGSFLYLRLRRSAYSPAELDAWAARLTPFLDAGLDAYAFLRHDAVGLATGWATALAAGVERRRALEASSRP